MKDAGIAIIPLTCNASMYLFEEIDCKAGLSGINTAKSPKTNKPIPNITPFHCSLSIVRSNSNQLVNKLPEPNLNTKKNSTDVLLIEQNLIKGSVNLIAHPFTNSSCQL